MNKLYGLSFITLLFFSGCYEVPKKIVHVEEKMAPEPIAITDYSELTELFVEFDPFVINQPSTFLAHFTYMDTFKPFKKGRVEACLTFHNQKKECFSVDAPASVGIFKPVAIPTQTGGAKLSITIALNDIKVTHQLGEFKVYASANQIHAAHEDEHDHAHEDEHDHAHGDEHDHAHGDEHDHAHENEDEHAHGDEEGISYLKEQQWQVEFATQVVKKRLLRESVSTFTKIEIPSNEEYLLSAPVSGIITPNSDIQVGMEVKANQTIAHITPLLGHKEDISTLKFELKKAQANLNLKKNENLRLQKLKAKNAVSQKRLIAAEQDYEMAKAQLFNVKQRLQQFDTSSSNKLGISLKSPIKGTIAKQLALPGSFVNEGDPIAHIINLEKLWLNVNIAQSDTYKIDAPLGVEILSNGNPLDFTVGKNAKFLYFSDTIDPKTRCASLIFEINDAPSYLKAGARFAVKAYTGKTVDALAIPKSSIVNDNGQHVVYVQIDGEHFERRNVQTGLSDTGYIEVHSGVSEGERIVSKGAYQVLLSALTPAEAGHGHAH